MARRFVNGDSITTAIGAVPTTRVGTWIALVRAYDSAFDLLTTNTDILTSRNGTTAVGAFFIDSGKLFANADFGSGASGPTDKTVWYVVAVTKATGTVAYRYHIAPLGGSWVHTGSGTAADGSGATNLLFGTGPIKSASKFEIAAAAIYGPALSDTAVAALGTTSMDTWLAASPVGAWQFNQPSVATAITDLTGNGANQTAITGTAVTADPVGWTYHASTTPFTKTVTESYRVLNAFTSNYTESYRVLNAWTKPLTESYRVLNAWTNSLTESYRIFNAFTKPVAESYRVFNPWTFNVAESYRVLNAFTKPVTESYRVLNAWSIAAAESYRVFNAFAVAATESYRIFNPWTLAVPESYRVLNAWTVPVAESYRIFNSWTLSLTESYDVLGGTAFTADWIERYRIFNAFTKPVTESYRVLNAWTFDTLESYRVLNPFSLSVSELYDVLGNSWSFSTIERYCIFNAWLKSVTESYSIGESFLLPPDTVIVDIGPAYVTAPRIVYPTATVSRTNGIWVVER